MITAGPNAGVNGTGVTDVSGQARFTWTGSGGPGEDTVQASFVDGGGNTQTVTAVKRWTGAVVAGIALQNRDDAVAPLGTRLRLGTRQGLAGQQPVSSSSRASELPLTGMQLDRLLTLAGGLVVSGLTLLALARRRRTS